MNKSTNELKRWVCEKRGHCKARVTTSANLVIMKLNPEEIQNSHTHGPAELHAGWNFVTAARPAARNFNKYCSRSGPRPAILIDPTRGPARKPAPGPQKSRTFVLLYKFPTSIINNLHPVS